MKRILRWARLPHLAIVCALALGVGCTTTDPYTGEQKIDPVPTAAAVAGTAALGALVWGATNDDDDDHRHHGRGHGHGRGYRPFSPANGVWCYPDQQRCYNEDGFAKKWTRRVFED
jgi:hypothetical protein